MVLIKSMNYSGKFTSLKNLFFLSHHVLLEISYINVTLHKKMMTSV